MKDIYSCASKHMVNLLNFTHVMATALVTLGFTPDEVKPPKKNYNVLFIVCDDLNDVSIYNSPKVKTPNLDRLAGRGIRFNRAYCQYSLSNPSRSSVLTGLRPDETKVLGNGIGFREINPDVITLPQLFMQNGYYSAAVGKIFHYNVPAVAVNLRGFEDPASWNYSINPVGRDVFEYDLVRNFTRERYEIKLNGLGNCLAYLEDEGIDDEQTDGIVASEAIKLMKQNKDKPFFLAVGFWRPHTPYIAPKKYFDMYPLDETTLPIPKKNLDDLPNDAITTRPTNFGLTDDHVKEIIRAYSATVSFVDAQVGKVLDALDQLGLSDKTIIVFMSDNGVSFSEHGQFFKLSLFEITNRIPLIISVPEGLKSKESDRIVELVDIYPTLTDLCNLKMPSTQHLSGTSLKPLLVNPTAKWDREAYSQVSRGKTMGRSVRTERWRYNEWDEGRAGTELYDEDNDKGELINLAKNSEYAEIVKELSLLLRKSYNQK
jgi:iduronate 2-sulfatase